MEAALVQVQKSHVAIIGAGASGVILASALIRPPAAVNVVLIDPRPGRGVGYGGAAADVLLNTRAGNMSINARSPEGFVDWLNASAARPDRWTTEDFAPRALFGDYLQRQLACLEGRTPGLGTTRVVKGSALAAERTEDGWSIRLASGERVLADALVLATGWARPRPLLFQGREVIEAFVQDDPWDEQALEALPRGGAVLLIGTGLTALDVAQAVWRRSPQTRVIAVSRHGMLPRVHGSPEPTAPVLSKPYPKTARELYAKLRAAAAFVEGDPSLRHGVFLNLREVAADLWDGLSEHERRMFLRHFRRYWEVERHRTPPAQAEAVRTALDEGRFEVERGRLAEGLASPDGVAARVGLLTSKGPRALCVTRIINCTGPEQDPFRSRNPLLLDLLAQGAAAADPLGLGLHVDGQGDVLDARGQASPGLYALGPPTQGRFFEITSVAEIRSQADRLAGQLLANVEVPEPIGLMPWPTRSLTR